MQQRGPRLGDVRVRRGRRRSETITVRRMRVERPRRPGVLVLIAGFLILIAIGTALLMLPIASEDRHGAPFLRALFTATSAVCVTGLVLVDTREAWSTFGEAVILVLFQLGGIGFMTSATLLLMVLGRRISMSQRMTVGDAAGHVAGTPMRVLIRRIVATTLAIEAVGAVGMVVAFSLNDRALGAEQLWRGLFTAVSAFNNAGFDLEGGGNSLLAYSGNPLVMGIVAVLAFLGASGYAVWWDIVRTKRWRRFQLNTKIVLATTAMLTFVGAGVVFVNEAATPGSLSDVHLAEAGALSLFESVYARTSGFTAMDLSRTHDETLLVIVALMFIGGASASTAGGIKMNTFSVLLFTIIASVRGDERVHVFQREIPWRNVNRALAVALLSVAMVVSVTFVLALATEDSMMDVLFEAVSAFATCGLSTGITGALDQFAQTVVIITMFVGRLGPLTFAVALAERFERRERVRYPEAEVNIG